MAFKEGQKARGETAAQLLRVIAEASAAHEKSGNDEDFVQYKQGVLNLEEALKRMGRISHSRGGKQSPLN